MSNYSRIKYEVGKLDITYKHQLEIMELEHEAKKQEILSNCEHKYDNGVSSLFSGGSQFNQFRQCSICGSRL